MTTQDDDLKIDAEPDAGDFFGQAETYEVPPLEPGHVGIELDFPLPDHCDSLLDALYEGNPSMAEHYGICYDVALHPVADEGPSGVPVVRMSGHHLRVRDALADYMGDEQLAAEAYVAVMNVNPTGSVVGGVEARIGVRDEVVQSFELRPNTAEPRPEDE